MKIALVHSFYTAKQPSGENNAVKEQASALRANGHDVRLFALYTDELARARRYQIDSAIRVSTGIGISPSADISEFDPDVVHVHNLFPNFGSRWLSDVRAPIVTTLHNYRPFCAAGSFYRDGQECYSCVDHSSASALRHACYRGSYLASAAAALHTRRGGPAQQLLSSSSALITLSDRTRRMYARLLPDSMSSRLHAIPNFTPDVLANSERKHGYWVFAGRLTPEKGVMQMLAAWPTDSRLMVIGSGPLSADVEAACERIGARAVGALSHAETRSRIAGSRGLVFPSRWKEPAAALSYLEALAAGVPTIASPDNAVADDVSEAGSGIVVENDTYAEAIARIDSERELFERNAKARYESRYSRSRWLNDIESLYERVCENR